MKCTRLELETLCIPFRGAFTHALASRSVTETAWVTAHADKRRGTPIVGYGESCPRDYVTGESLPTVRAFFARYADDAARSATDIDALRDWVMRHRPIIDANPAAWCAIELAIIDVFCKRNGCSVEALLGLPELSGDYRYTAVVDCGADADRRIAGYQRLGMRDWKAKLTGDVEVDGPRVSRIRKWDRDITVRCDANRCFATVAEAADYFAALGYDFIAVEEPLRGAGDVDGYASARELSDRLAVPIILDESLLRPEQLEELPSCAAGWIVNVRVSKMGGLLRSLELMRRAADRGSRIVLGAHVGETSLLTRAGLTLATAAGESLFGLEGAFGDYLLEYDPVTPSLRFGDAGRLDVCARAAQGWCRSCASV